MCETEKLKIIHIKKAKDMVSKIEHTFLSIGADDHIDFSYKFISMQCNICNKIKITTGRSIMATIRKNLPTCSCVTSRYTTSY